MAGKDLEWGYAPGCFAWFGGFECLECLFDGMGSECVGFSFCVDPFAEHFFWAFSEFDVCPAAGAGSCVEVWVFFAGWFLVFFVPGSGGSGLVPVLAGGRVHGWGVFGVGTVWGLLGGVVGGGSDCVHVVGW